MSNNGITSNTWLFLSALISMLIGLTYSPLFFAFSVFLFAAAEARRSKVLGIIGATVGVVFLLLVLGYGIGKNAALRDSEQSATMVPGGAP